LLAGIAVLSWAGQTRFGWFPDRIQPGLVHAGGFGSWVRQTFSLTAWFSVSIAVLKLVVLVAIAAWIIAGDARTLLSMSGRPLQEGLGASVQYLGGLLVRLAAGAAVVGLADYGVRWWYNRVQLRMSDEEVRSERRATEAPSQISARRRLR
jgi:flagellar biosynthesis protein FlhB